MRYYDLIIVGAGPAGLALAHTSSSLYRKILIVDKELEIGGCHRVKRNSDGMFTEHGPRIYLSIYYFLMWHMIKYYLHILFMNYLCLP
jgi:uncharacterized protein with NAD-binding domain and iron-sulfur cluster